MTAIWVLSADNTRARFFSATTRKGDLKEHLDLVNPEARLHERDLSSDMTGRAANSAAGTVSSYGESDKHKTQAVTVFARAIAAKLEHERATGSFEKLYIVAEPGFLGVLRRELDRNTANTVAATVNKNLTRSRLVDIRAALPDFL